MASQVELDNCFQCGLPGFVSKPGMCNITTNSFGGGLTTGPLKFNYANNSKATEDVKYARVIKERHPCVYDTTALSLKVGDIIRVKKRPVTGIWRGDLIFENGVVGKSGWFPFTHVEFLDGHDHPKLRSELSGVQ